MSLDNQNIRGADDMIRRLREAQEYIQQDVPVAIGKEAVKHFKQGFEDEGFTDSGLTKWASRKTKRSGSTNSQKILSKDGHLKDSITDRVEGNTVIISSHLPYAEVHNEGYNGPQSVPAHTRKGKDVRAHTRNMKMPKRQFIGESQQLNNKIAGKITRDLTRILNN